jgi:hypothetical protein
MTTLKRQTASTLLRPPARHRGAWRWLVWAIVAAWALGSQALSAQETERPAQPQAEFWIERITVENVKTFRPEIIVAESLLAEGQPYSERELGDAIHRIVRLPLVLRADFALRKGTQRGRYELVITVEEVSRFFVGLDGTTDAGDDLRGIPGLDVQTEEEARASDDQSQLVGARMAAGRYGLLAGAVDPFNGGAVQLGYTHYNLLDHSIQLGIDLLVEPLERGSARVDSRLARFSLGIPIRGNHSLRIAASASSSDFDFGFGGRRFEWQRERLAADISWVYNSLDDPLFPSSGRFLRTGLGYRRGETRELFTTAAADGSFSLRTSDLDEEDLRVFLAGDRYWQLSRLDSVSLSVDLSLGRSTAFLPLPEGPGPEVDADVWRGEVAFGYNRFLLRSSGPKWRELRWETEIGVFHEGTSPDFDLPWNPRTGLRLSSGLGFRTRWGVFRYLVNFYELSR